MKLIILLILTHLCVLANAGWMLKSDIQSGITAGKLKYISKDECEKVGVCFEIPDGQDPSTYDVVQVEEDGQMVDKLQQNPTKLAAKMEEISKGAQISSYEATGATRRTYGQKLISITTGYTAGLNLSSSESLALASSMNQIITFANLGRIDLAKTAIQAYVPDAYFTQEFKDLLLWDIQRNGY